MWPGGGVCGFGQWRSDSARSGRSPTNEFADERSVPLSILLRVCRVIVTSEQN
jgi:hypothetical protein